MVGTNLKEYFDLLATDQGQVRRHPVGASESIFSPLAQATGLDLLTPAGFLTAISEGTDPTPRDTATIDAQIRNHEIKVYVYNSQNATPDVQRQVAAGRGGRDPGHDGHRDPHPGRRLVPGLAGPPTPRAEPGAGDGDRHVSAPGDRRGKPGHEVTTRDDGLSPGRPAVDIEDAAVRLGGRTVWSGVTATVRAGEFAAILGPNGVGKSTLIKAMLGLQPLAAGQIRVLGRAGRAGPRGDRVPAAAPRVRRLAADPGARRGAPRRGRASLGAAAARAALPRRGGPGGRGDRPGRGAGLRRPPDRPAVRWRAAAPADRPGSGARDRGCCCWTSRWTPWT